MDASFYDVFPVNGGAASLNATFAEIGVNQQVTITFVSSVVYAMRTHSVVPGREAVADAEINISHQ